MPMYTELETFEEISLLKQHAELLQNNVTALLGWVQKLDARIEELEKSRA